MSANDSAVNEQVFQIRVSRAKLMQLLENPGIDPARKAFIGGIPVAVFFGQQAPLSARASDPKDSGKEALALPFGPDVYFRARA
jgi:hypothetical protein